MDISKRRLKAPARIQTNVPPIILRREPLVNNDHNYAVYDLSSDSDDSDSDSTSDSDSDDQVKEQQNGGEQESSSDDDDSDDNEEEDDDESEDDKVEQLAHREKKHGNKQVPRKVPQRIGNRGSRMPTLKKEVPHEVPEPIVNRYGPASSHMRSVPLANGKILPIVIYNKAPAESIHNLGGPSSSRIPSGMEGNLKRPIMKKSINSTEPIIVLDGPSSSHIPSGMQANIKRSDMEKHCKGAEPIFVLGGPSSSSSGRKGSSKRSIKEISNGGPEPILDLGGPSSSRMQNDMQGSFKRPITENSASQANPKRAKASLEELPAVGSPKMEMQATPMDTSIACDRLDDLYDQCCCSICSETFDSIKFVPRVLDCGHTFCEVCIFNEKLCIENVITCPNCTLKTSLRDGKTLPKNFSMISMAEHIMQSRINPKFVCKSCKIKTSSSCIRICVKEDCAMFNQFICANCAMDGGHADHTIKYDVKLKKIRDGLRDDVVTICSEIEEMKGSLMTKARQLAEISKDMEKKVLETNIPRHVIGQIESISSEQEATEYREIVNDLSRTIKDEFRSLTAVFNLALTEATKFVE